MTIHSIDVTKDLPESRERAVLLEMLKVVPLLKAEGVDAVICGGWVPFLKELARNCRSDHTMSLDIYVLLSARDRERDSIDRDCISVSWFTVVAFCTPWVCTKDDL